MSGIATVMGPACSLPLDDVDTDVIFPARFLLHTEKQGLGRFAFHDRRDIRERYEAAGRPEILMTGANFGCGSSREHAVWALAGLGVRAIVAPSFGEIFRGNCVNNGLIAARVDPIDAELLHRAAQTGAAFMVELRPQEIRAGDRRIDFEIPPADREMLLAGWNATTRILALHGCAIDDFERDQRLRSPWLWTEEKDT